MGTVDDEFLQFPSHAHVTFTVLRSHSLSIFIFNGGYRITNFFFFAKVCHPINFFFFNYKLHP